MIPIRITIVTIFCVLNCSFVAAQTIDLKGKVVANGDIDRIHVINKTAQKFTATNEYGEFEILASLNDTILVSGIQYQPKTVVVTPLIMQAKTVTVQLTDNINQLDEVIVGKVLTGDLLSDMKNSDAKADLNFYDVGIPGYTGKRKTQKERRLYEADAGKSFYIAPLFVGINIHKILNKISGRTKKLKLIVRLEQQDACMEMAKAEFSDDIFGNLELEESLKSEFFYYASEDPKFLDVCNRDNKLELFEFLVGRLINFNENVESVDD